MHQPHQDSPQEDGIAMSNNIHTKLRRMYAAIGKNYDSEIQKYRATVIANNVGIFMHQDFRNGQTDEDLLNDLHSLIGLVASIENFLYVWAGQDKAKKKQLKTQIKDHLGQSNAFSIVVDLWNSDKHANEASPRQARTHKGPVLTEINRVMQMTANPGSGIMFIVGRNGRPIVQGEGTTESVITADVRSKDGEHMGWINEILLEAIKDCEALVTDLRIPLPK
jgi:hypothetical protein